MVGTICIATTVALSFLATQALASPAPQPIGDAIATIVPERTCEMTSKRGRDCNRSAYRHGGGYCSTEGGVCEMVDNGATECVVQCTCEWSY